MSTVPSSPGARVPAADASVSLSTPALLSFHRDLLRACGALDKPLEEWRALFRVCERVVGSIANVVPRWQTLLQAESQRLSAEERQAATRHSGSEAAAAAADDPHFFAAPLALPSLVTPTEAAPAADIGVLATLPGVASKLQAQHQRQIEIAYDLLRSTQYVHEQTHCDMDGATPHRARIIMALPDSHAGMFSRYGDLFRPPPCLSSATSSLRRSLSCLSRSIRSRRCTVSRRSRSRVLT